MISNYFITKVPEHVLSGLGGNLHQITDSSGNVVAHLAMKDKSVVVHFDKIITVKELRELTEFMINESYRFMVG